MPQYQLTNPDVSAIESATTPAMSYTIARHENNASVTYQLNRIGRGFDSLSLERLPGGVSITKRVTTRGRTRTVNLLIPTELSALFLEEFAGLVEGDDTALGAPVAAVEHVAPRALIELHPAGGGLE